MTTENQTPGEGEQNATPEIVVDIPSAPTAKKRGRPSNAERAARESNASAAEQIEAGNTPTPGKSKSTAKAKSSKRVTASDVGALAKQLVGLHQLGAMISGIPEVMISDGEGALLASGIVAVCEEYDLSIDGKTGAALQLLGAAAVVYAPRAFKVMARSSATKKAAKAAARDAQQSASGDTMPPGTFDMETPNHGFTATPS